ncbi:ferredoxin [Salinispora arenicola]|uniref:ferredoxin n=1 Tax=Salinispora arenicola TaxID=168697 RepID=UPI0002E78EB0|nr:ferredoxin [Salinispora arenicola]MCN0178461.1 ferredoxin [Salinispora arenicola]
MVKVNIDRDRCYGLGQCVLAAPAVFDQDDDGIVWLLVEEARPEQHDEVRQAALACPRQAIGVAD